MRGAFCLVLHGHLPWVLHHGRWPHGEDWLFEAAFETWLPLLSVLDQCAEEGIRPAWTVGVMPILLEQLASERFKVGLRRYLADAEARAALDQAEFSLRGDAHLAWLAGRHQIHISDLRDRFNAIHGDLIAALVAHADAGRIELLSSNATHGYHPLILHDACARAQLRAGLATSERHFGRRPVGIWLPECAYRPEGDWFPPAVHGDPRRRDGVATLCADEGVDFFFVDAHLVQGSRSVALVDGERIEPVDPGRGSWDRAGGWGSPMEPVRVAEGGITAVRAVARHPAVSEQVWSGDVGYPGDPAYLEFHKRHGTRGLRYWKVTGRDVDLGGKDPYYPDDVASVVFQQAEHFVGLVKEQVEAHQTATGRCGVVCAPFDAELFGHWWHEGPQFLLELARRMANDVDVRPVTVSEYLAAAPPDKAVAMPEGSWGDGGDHRVWLNDELMLYWQVAYRAEDRFLDLWHRAPWRADDEVREWLTAAGRQLLLLQASDWPFVVSTGGAVDYGMRRILDHAARFDDLANAVEDQIAGHPIDAVARNTRDRCELLEPVFPDLDLAWWG